MTMLCRFGGKLNIQSGLKCGFPLTMRMAYMTDEEAIFEIDSMNPNQ